MTYGDDIRVSSNEKLAEDHYTSWGCLYAELPDKERPCGSYESCYDCKLAYVNEHGDEIRAKSDEELADDPFIWTGCKCPQMKERDCHECKLKWLKSEVSSAENSR